MYLLPLLGYLLAILVGISLGLIGGGGSILAVPILVYLMGLSPVLATQYSLFVVGLSSSFGAFNFYRLKLISLPVAGLFGFPALLAIIFTRRWLLPYLPQQLFQIADVWVTKNILLMALFALLMIIASAKMIRSGKDTKATSNYVLQWWPLIFRGLGVGFITGLVGAGGGFLIIPALVFMAGLPMKKAVGTSLLIIAVNSLLGFWGSFAQYAIQWKELLLFSALAVGGIFIGTLLSQKIAGYRLRPIFGWFILIMGGYILVREIALGWG